MPIAEITKEISVLSRFEKILLIETISKMLLEEEDNAEPFDLQKSYAVFTPLDQEKGANQLQQFLDQNRS